MVTGWPHFWETKFPEISRAFSNFAWATQERKFRWITFSFAIMYNLLHFPEFSSFSYKNFGVVKTSGLSVCLSLHWNRMSWSLTTSPSFLETILFVCVFLFPIEEGFSVQDRVFPSGGTGGDPPSWLLSPSIKALYSPQKFLEDNRENNSLLLKIPH